MEIGKKMGADYSLKATDNMDRVQFIRDNTDGYGADIVVEMAGAKQAVLEGLDSLRKVEDSRHLELLLNRNLK